jgi:DNA-binding GntR family transcriptional regulator
MSEQGGPAPFLYQSKSSAVYLELRQRILSAALAPGTAINQEHLAADLGVSTTPLREALRRLESEGLVQLLAHREAIVAPLDAAELAAVYEVREQLDPLAAALAAERHTTAEGSAIRKATARTRRPGREDQMTVNRRYHASIYGACHNPVLIATLDALWDRSDRYRRAVGHMGAEAAIQDEHIAIADAVLGRRAEESAELMRNHIRRTRMAFQQRHEG